MLNDIFGNISHEIVVQAAIAVVSMIGGWIITRLKRKKNELPPLIEKYQQYINYEDLYDAWRDAERLYKDPEARRKYMIEKLNGIARQKLGTDLPAAVANFMVEFAVQLSKAGWSVIKKRL